MNVSTKRRTIFDLLNGELNYEEEYESLRNLFLNENNIKYQRVWRTYEYVCNAYIEWWKYRGTKSNVKDIMNSIGLKSKPVFEYWEACIYLCEFILNMRLFVQKMQSYEGKDVYSYDIIDIEDKMLIDNINYILSKLGYKQVIKKDTLVLLKNNSDAETTALIVEDDDLSINILKYNDFRISRDVEAKRDILRKMASYFEPHKSDIEKLNSDLADNISMALNTLNIRHNNLSGKYKIEYTSKLKDKEFIKLYDDLYNWMLVAFRMIEIPNMLADFKNIRHKEFNK